MSKTALEMFRDIKEFETPDGSEITVADIVPYFCEKIEKALQRLEAIDNAEPSEAINYLDSFINEMTNCLENSKQYAKEYEKEIFYKYKHTLETIIKQALIKAQEQEKKNDELYTIKALEYFIDMKEANQLDYGDEYIKCLAIENELIFADFMKRNLQRWLELLETDGIDSKNMVACDIQAILKEVNK